MQSSVKWFSVNFGHFKVSSKILLSQYIIFTNKQTINSRLTNVYLLNIENYVLDLCLLFIWFWNVFRYIAKPYIV